MILSSQLLRAQVSTKLLPHVYEESHHELIYEDSLMRVLNVFAQKGDTTLFHIHCDPIVYITLHGTEVSLQQPNGIWKNVLLPTDWIGHDVYHIDSCFTHRFTVAGEGHLQILAIEAKTKFASQQSLNQIKYNDEFRINELENFYNSTDLPIIFVEKNCDGKCDIKVIKINQIKRIENLSEHRMYSVEYVGAED